MQSETPDTSDCQIARRLLEHCDNLMALLESAATTARAVDSIVRQGKQQSSTESEAGSDGEAAANFSLAVNQSLNVSQQQLRQEQLRVRGSIRPLLELGQQLGVEPGTRGWVQRLVGHLPPAKRHHVSARLFELKQRYRDIMALSVANQTVLVYSLDFCRRLLGDQAPPTLAYNRHGTGEPSTVHRSVTRSRVC